MVTFLSLCNGRTVGVVLKRTEVAVVVVVTEHPSVRLSRLRCTDRLYTITTLFLRKAPPAINIECLSLSVRIPE